MAFEDYSFKEIRTGAAVFSGYAFSSKDMNDEKGISIIKIANIQNREVTLEGSQFFAEELVNAKLNKFFLKDNDVLIAMTGQGSVGRVGQLRLNGDKALLNQRVGKFIVDNQNLDRDYLYFVISSPRYEKILFDIGAGSGQPNLSPEQILSLKIPMPRIEVQRKIAEILCSLNNKIKLNNKINRDLEAVGEAVFRRWFVDFEFPNQEGKPYKSTGEKMESTQFGEIPKNWEIKRLGNITDVIFSGGTPNTQDEAYWNGEFPWLSSGETCNHFIIKTIETITQNGIDNSSTRLAKAGDVVIASAGQGKTRGQTSLCFLDTYINQSIIAIRAKNHITTSSFLYFDLARRYNQLRALSDSNSIRGSLTTRTFKGLEVIKPPFKLVSDFDSFITPLLKKIKINLQENEILTESRDLLLPKLMSGKIRVPFTNEEMGAIKIA